MADDQWAAPVPEAVRRASARADELAREAGVANVPDAEPPPVDNPEGNSPVGELPLPSTPSESSPLPPPEQSSAPVETAPQEPAREAAPESPEPPPAPPNEWEQRYQTLQGKYNSELPELRGQIRSLQDLIAGMQRADNRATEVRDRAPEIPQTDIEAYGQDLITAAQRWAEARLAPRFAEHERRLSQVESGGEQIARHTSAQAVEHALDREIADWRVVNVDPKFLLWLDATDPFTGQKRQALVNDAYKAGDAARTLAFFRAYQAEQTAVTPGNGVGTRPRQTNGATPPAAAPLPLADLAVPGRGQTAAPSAPGAPERRMWTNAEIATFYRQKQQGRWNGREADAAALERDIFAAASEGRVRP